MTFFERVNAMTPQQALLAYLERGKSVFPVRPDKRPRLPWKVYQTTLATPYEAQRWIKLWPDMALGFPTGSYNGFNVLDCDSAPAEKWLAANAPATGLMSRTRRGTHRFYRCGAFVVPTVTGIGGVPGIDARGEGGFVIVPPSVVGEHKYVWQIGDPAQPIPTLDAMDAGFFVSRPSPAPGGILRAHGVTNASTPRRYTDDGLVAVGGRDDYLTRLIMGIVASHVRDNETLPDPEDVALYAWKVFCAGADLSDGEYRYENCLEKAIYANQRVGDGSVLIYHDVPEDEQGFGKW